MKKRVCYQRSCRRKSKFNANRLLNNNHSLFSMATVTKVYYYELFIVNPDPDERDDGIV